MILRTDYNSPSSLNTEATTTLHQYGSVFFRFAGSDFHRFLANHFFYNSRYYNLRPRYTSHSSWCSLQFHRYSKIKLNRSTVTCWIRKVRKGVSLENKRRGRPSKTPMARPKKKEPQTEIEKLQAKNREQRTPY